MTTGSAGPRARPEATAKQDRARSQAKLWAVKSRRRHWRPVTPRWLFGTRAAVARGRAGPGAPPTERGHQTSKKRVLTVVPPVSAETKSHGRGSFKKIDRVGQEAAHKGRQPCRAERRAHLPEVPALARGRRSPWKAVRLLRAGATVPKPTPLGALEVVRGRDERGRARTPPALAQWETSGKRDPKRSPWFKQITDTPLTVT